MSCVQVFSKRNETNPLCLTSENDFELTKGKVEATGRLFDKSFKGESRDFFPHSKAFIL